MVNTMSRMKPRVDINGQPIPMYGDTYSGNTYGGGSGSDMTTTGVPDFGSYQQIPSSDSSMFLQGATAPPADLGISDVGSSVVDNAKPAEAGIASLNPYLAAAGLGLSAAGTVADIYGKYQAREDAKKQYEQMLELQKEQQRKLDEDRARAVEQQRLQQGYFASDFAQGLQDRLGKSYGGYKTGGQ